MPRVLSLCLTFHWMVVFGLLSFFTIRSIGRADEGVLGTLGIELAEQDFTAIDRSVPALFAIMISIVSALFLWAFLTQLAEGTEETKAGGDAVRIAFSAAIGLMTFSLAIFALFPLSGQMLTAAVFCAALLVSYRTIATERGVVVASAEAPGDVSARLAKLMARDASRIAEMPRGSNIYAFPEKER